MDPLIKSAETMQRYILNHTYWLIPLVLWTTVVGISFAWNWNVLDRHSREIAANRAEFVFKMVESVRLWNARHGGVYVLVDGETQPNPYLEIGERDISTPSGKPLTLLNPAFMTRQLTYVVEELSDIRVHLTSLKPINPDNVADPWETRALQAFEAGSERVQGLVGQGQDAVYRFMAPLITKKSCLKCHEKQGYEVGDIRGGASVTFKAASLLTPQYEQKWNMAGIHFAVWLLLSGLTLFALSRFRTQMLLLKAAKEQQDRVVEQRTAELSQQVQDREQAEEELRLLIDSSGEGIYGIDKEGRFTFINPMALHLLGYSDADSMIGQNVCDMVCHTQTDDKASGVEVCGLRSALEEGRVAHSEEEYFRRADGQLFRVEFRSHPLMREGELLGAVVTFADITERKTLEEKIWRQAHYDALTKLPNRSLFHDRLNQTLLKAQRQDELFALLFVDLDRFKHINDSLGHEAGDQLLKEVARRLTACVRDSDSVARMGGDEFNIILTGIANREGVERVAGEVLAQMCRPFDLAGTQQCISASVGIACYPDDGDSAAELLRNADLAMYRAKQGGRDRFSFYQPSPVESSPTGK
ncbi:diguanylate cyclase domain-containing protein [Sedimenticola selenatireducens]|uniref:diguanylate cyclase domain-containing protein n=1 Tax=Sedimenticola selenatireducens TaxID=191960 RepID=UPI003F4AB8C7